MFFFSIDEMYIIDIMNNTELKYIFLDSDEYHIFKIILYRKQLLFKLIHSKLENMFQYSCIS